MMNSTHHLTAWAIGFKAQAIALMPKFLFALIAFLLFIIIALSVNSIAKRLIGKSTKHKDLANLLCNLIRTIILITGTITALGTIGVNVSAIVASLGLFSFTVGFAFKDFLSNTLAGILIILYQPFKVGHCISCEASNNKFEGKVKEINLRYTKLSNETGIVLIPNSVAFTNVITIAKPENQPACK